MAPTVNRDVEETRAIEKQARKDVRIECELLCIALLHTAADGKASDMMVMLEMISARVILEISERLKMSVDSILEMNNQHIVRIIKVLKERM
jgi:flagellar motor switch/type III secretory pathway protein FliN